ncbi:MAG: hypothetical protein GF346_04940 [Candidatus Eisenbacteria bacterium]|nr:hypothetical protein [Candidatus Latescibacterota bacterium]MBD3301772.1 hypothetical protein [Candidatus Eisenbacteria bacterium]
MDRPETTPFGGIAGRVVREALSAGTFFSGVVLAIGMALCVGLFSLAKADFFVALSVQILPLLFLARFALNGYAGEFGGTIFSGRGGSMIDASKVAGRLVLLMLLWAIPMGLLLQSKMPEGPGASFTYMLMTGNDTMLFLAVAYLAGTALTPPLFLIGSVAAARTSDLFSPDCWRELFAGRFGDLLLVYCLYVGAMSVVVLAMMPAVVVFFNLSKELGLLVGVGMLVFAVGFGLNLLGRLCGFYAATVRPDLWAPQTIEREGVPAGPEPVSGPRPVRPVPLGPTAIGSTKASLLDARERVAVILEGAETDPSGAIEELEDLDRTCAANPLVLQAIARLRLRTAADEDAYTATQRAMELILERDAIRLAAELYTELRRTLPERRSSLPLRTEDLHAIAAELRGLGETEAAAEIWREMLAANPGERQAMKGLIQVAEAWMRGSGRPVVAAEIYRFLLDHAGDSPLRPLVEQGLEDAQRRIDREERRSA